MFYSIETIKIILTASGIMPERLISGVDFSPMILSYQYSRDKKICFLWGHENAYSAIMVDFIQTSKTGKKVKCYLLGEAGNQEKAPFLIKQLQQTYTSPQICLQPLDDQNKDIVFTECLLQLLHQGKIGEIDVQKSCLNHRRLCAEAAAHKLKVIKIKNPEHYKKIAKRLGILWKYSALKAFRSTYKLADANLEFLENTQYADERTKKNIYSKVITEIETYIEKLSLVMLLDFLKVGEESSYIELLQQESIIQLNDIKTWKLQLTEKIKHQKRDFKNYFTWLGNKAVTGLYQYSFIGLGAELAQWSGKKVLDLTENTTFGGYVAHHGGQYISKNSIVKISKMCGAIVGTGFTYAAGSYTVGKSLFTSFMGLRLKSYFTQDKINDQTAEILSCSDYFSDIAFIRLVSLGIASIETVYTGSYEPIMYALGGITGSASISALGEKILSSTPDMLDVEEQKLLLLLLAITGYDIGSLVSVYLYNGIDKMLSREKLTQAFCQQIKENKLTVCTTDFTQQSVGSLGFWLNPNDKVRLGWGDGKYVEHSNCEVIKLSGNERDVICELPENTQILSLSTKR